jgi:ABC-type nitrate/sulfonate/bicarbonate transport system substrate-binding protein
MKLRSTRKAAIGVLCAVIALALAACADGGSAGSSNASGKKLTKVTEVGFKVMSLAPVYVASDRGIFEKHGLDFTLNEIESGKLGVAALLSGDAQFVDLGIDDVINLRKEGRDIKLFYNLERPLTMDFVMRKQVADSKGVSLTSPLDDRFRALKGLKIGTTRPGAPTDLYPRYFMKQVGLAPDRDATFVPIGNAAALLGALKAGRIDGFMLSPPAPYLAEKQGFGQVLIKSKESLPVFKEYDFTSVAVRESYATKNPDAVKGYSAAVSEASKWMLEHRDEALQDLHDRHFQDTDLPTLKLSLDLFLEAMNPDGTMSAQAIQNQISVLSSLGALKDAGSVPVSDLMTTQYTAAG